MLRHVILWKLKEDLADVAAVKAGIKAGLEGLVGQVPGLLRAKVQTEGLATSTADVMLDAYFADAAALAAYAVHPAHVAVANGKVRPYTASRACLDFAGAGEFGELLAERRSVRAFLPTVPPSALVDEVVKAGLLAPTGRNQQSSLIVRIDDPALQAEIRAENARILGAPPPGHPADPFYSAPVMLLVIADRQRSTATYDGSLALGNMMLKAHALGLASCWIHRAREEMEGPLGAKIRARLGLAGEWEGVGHLALGYAAAPLAAPREANLARYRVI
ncbi:MAG: nitroreductase family protein [Kiritimatiellia bacterium]